MDIHLVTCTSVSRMESLIFFFLPSLIQKLSVRLLSSLATELFAYVTWRPKLCFHKTGTLTCGYEVLELLVSLRVLFLT